MESYDFKSRVKELSESLRGATDFRSTFSTENVPTGLLHMCDAEFYYKNDTYKIPIKGHGIRSKKKEAEQVAFRQVLDKILQKDGFPIGNSSSEYDSLTKRLLDLWGQRRKTLNTTRHSEATDATPNASLSRVVPTDAAGVRIDDLDDDSTLAQSLVGSAKNDLETHCRRAKPRYPDPRFSLLNDWTLADNSHRFKVQCTVSPENGPEIVTHGVAIKKANAEKVAALKMKNRLEVLNVPQQNGILDCREAGGNVSKRDTRAVSLEGTSSGFSFLSESPRRQTQTLPVANGTLVSPSHLPSPTKIEPGGILVKDKIVYFPNRLLSEGGSESSSGNKVYKGYYETPRKEAAVKRIPLAMKDSKCDELKFLREFEHANVVRYFCTEEKELYQFIAMELASSTLEKIVVQNENEFPVLREFCHDISQGLLYLHEKAIIHRDLKPSNILIFSGHGAKKTAKLADFDISREFDFTRAGITTVQNRGTRTYMPPEAIRAQRSQTNAKSNGSFKLEPSFDIFSLALVIHFTMTRGRHLFVQSDGEFIGETEVNITRGAANWNYASEPKFIALRNLLAAMIRDNPQARPHIHVILEHPFFWDTDKGHDFIIDACTDISNFADPDVKSTIKSAVLQPAYSSFCDKYGKSVDWIERMCPIVQTWIREKRFGTPNGKAKNYQSQPNSIILLIELIRDQRLHYGNWASDKVLRSASVFGINGEKYAKYFEDRFPELVTLVYVSLQSENFQGDMLKSYYSYNVNNDFSVVNK